MTDETEKVLHGFLELTSNEKEDFIKEIENWSELSFSEKKDFQKSIEESVDVGPISSTCPCCGR